MKTLGVIFMVIYMTMLMYLLLAESIYYATAETCYYQYIHNMFLWACKKYWCCTYNMNNPHSIHDHLYRWSWGRWRATEVHCYCYSKHCQVLNIEQRAHWLPVQERTNQLCHVIMSLCYIVLSNGLHHLEFHARTLYFCGVKSFRHYHYQYLASKVYMDES